MTVNLVDSSAWIDFLRAYDSPARDEVRRLITAGDPIATTEPIIMELLAGAPSAIALERIATLSRSMDLLEVDPRLDYVAAATIFRATRSAGRTVRQLNDCLIAAIAIRHHATLLHKDAYFEAIATCVDLTHVALR